MLFAAIKASEEEKQERPSDKALNARRAAVGKKLPLGDY